MQDHGKRATSSEELKDFLDSHQTLFYRGLCPNPIELQISFGPSGPLLDQEANKVLCLLMELRWL
jgi:hypothetical protein